MTANFAIPRPHGEVDLNENIVTGQRLVGGYNAFQLYPSGAKISPTTGDTEKLTLSDVRSIFCYKGGGGQAADKKDGEDQPDQPFDLYHAETSEGFQRFEKIFLEGPNPDPLRGPFIMMRGEASGLTVRFNLASSTIGTASSTVAPPNSTLTVRFEQPGRPPFEMSFKV